MAQPLVCDLCGDPEDPVMFMVTITANGETLALGGACTPAWAVAVAQTITGIDLVPAGSGGEAGRADGGVSTEADPADPPAKRNGRKAKAAPAAEVEQEATAPAAAD